MAKSLVRRHTFHWSPFAELSDLKSQTDEEVMVNSFRLALLQASGLLGATLPLSWHQMPISCRQLCIQSNNLSRFNLGDDCFGPAPLDIRCTLVEDLREVTWPWAKNHHLTPVSSRFSRQIPTLSRQQQHQHHGGTQHYFARRYNNCQYNDN